MCGELQRQGGGSQCWFGGVEVCVSAVLTAHKGAAVCGARRVASLPLSSTSFEFVHIRKRRVTLHELASPGVSGDSCSYFESSCAHPHIQGLAGESDVCT